MVCGCTLVTVSVLFLFWVDIVPNIIPMFFLAIGNSIAVIPGISVYPYILQKSWWGRGYGSCVFALSLGQTIALLLSVFVDSAYYAFGSAIALFIALVLISILNIIDYRHGRTINRPRKYWRDIIWNNPKMDK